MTGCPLLHCLVVLAVLLLGCCTLPAASAHDSAGKEWLEQQSQLACVFKLQAATLECRTAEQLRDLEQLACRLAADLSAVESICKQVACIELQLSTSKCHPCQCDPIQCKLQKAIEDELALIACTKKAILAAEAAITAAECAAKEQLVRIAAVECDIAKLIQLLECALAAEQAAAEKCEPVCPELAAQWKCEIEALEQCIETALAAIACEAAAIDKQIVTIGKLLCDIELQLKALRCGLETILELLQCYNTCVADSEELAWLEQQSQLACVFKLQAATLECRTAEQLRDLEQLACRLAADLSAVESICKQVACIELQLSTSKCHPCQCDPIQCKLQKAIEDELALIACTKKAILAAEAAITAAECAAKEQLVRIAAVECDIAKLIQLLECALAAEQAAAEKCEPVCPELAAQWKCEIEALEQCIETALAAIACEAAAIDKQIVTIGKLLCDIELQLKALRCGLETILELLQCYNTCVADAEELAWLEQQSQLACVFKLQAATLECRTAEQLRDLEQLACRLAADLSAVESICKQVACIELQLSTSKCHPCQCDPIQCKLQKAIEDELALIACTKKAILAAEAAITAAECAAKEQLVRIAAVECDIAKLIQLLECALAAEQAAAEKCEPVCPELAAQWKCEIEALEQCIETALAAIACEAAAIDKQIVTIGKLLCDIELQLKALRCGLETILELLQCYNTCVADAEELAWLEQQSQLACVFKLQAATLECRTAEQLRDLEQLACRLAADLSAVESICKQVACIELQLSTSKCHPCQCDPIQCKLQKAIEDELALIACTKKAILAAEAAITAAECAAKEQLVRIAAVECDIAKLIQLLECALAAEQAAAEKCEPVCPELAAQWKCEIEALEQCIETALAAIACEAAAIDKQIVTIGKLLCDIELQLKALRCGLETILELLQCYNTCVADAEELAWLEQQSQLACVFKLQAATLECRTAEQLRDLEQLACRLAADLSAVESICKQVACIELQLSTSKCHPCQCDPIQCKLQKAIEDELALIACTKKAILAAEAAITAAECAAKEQLVRIAAVECDIAKLIQLLECALAAEQAAAEKCEPVCPELAAQWKCEIEALEQCIETALAAIACEAAAIDKQIVTIGKLLCDIELQLKALRCGLETILELLQCYNTCVADSEELAWLEQQSQLACVFKLQAATLECRTAEQLRDLEQLACRLAADLSAVESICKQVACIELQLSTSKCHPCQCDPIQCKLQKAIEDELALIACTKKAILAAEAAITAAECAAKEQLVRIAAVECDIAKLIQLLECALAAEQAAAEKCEPVCPELAAQWKCEIEALEQCIETALAAIACEAAAIDKQIVTIGKLLCDIDQQVRELLAGLGCIESDLYALQCCWEKYV